MTDELNLPAPLVPPDCNLRGMEWMPLDTVRLLESDLWNSATPEACKAAITLWCMSWRQVPASSVPSDDVILAKMSGAHARWSKVKEAALRGFVLCSDGRLYHPVVAEKARTAWNARLRQKDKANKRWHPENDAAAMPRQSRTDAAAMQGRGRGRVRGKEGQKKKRQSGEKPQAGIPTFQLPDWMPAAAWDGWVEMRVRIKKPMTERARDMAVAKLKAMKDGGHDIKAILERSEFKNYTDLYPLADQDRKAGSRNAGVAERFARSGGDG